MNPETHESLLLRRLAVAMTENPRSTIKELAEAVGISKATLHRFCGTRENLELMLIEASRKSLDHIIDVAEKDFDNYQAGLRELIQAHYQNREYHVFSSSNQACMTDDYWFAYLKAIDAFFLKGQKKGTFRLELGVSFLSESFISILCGIIDAERRGRIASMGAEAMIENLFLTGALEQ